MMTWKSNLASQLKQQKNQWNIYGTIIEHYNRLIDSNIYLQSQCHKLEKDVQHLRLSNVGLERASGVTQELSNANNKLTVATEEVITHLREKGELANEILRLNRSLTECQEKLAREEAKVQQFTEENDNLLKKVDRCECEINELVQTNQVLRDEFESVHRQLDQCQADYNQLKPTCYELEQKLEQEKRINQQREQELVECKSRQLEMLNAEVERYNRRLDQRKGSDASLQSALSTTSRPNLADDIASQSERKSDTNGIAVGPNKFFSTIKGLFVQATPAMLPRPRDRINTYCVSAAVPTREIYRWDCTDLEVYTLKFHPFRSILATGCSDKQIHLWEIASNGHPYPHGSLHGSHGAINTLDFDNEGANLIAGCSGEKTYIWSCGDNRALKDTYIGHTSLIYTCKFLSSTKLVTGGSDRVIKTWDLHGRHCIRTLFITSKCHDLVITDSSGTMISGHFDKKIRTWDSLTDQCRHEYTCDASVTSLAYNMEKQQLLACCKDDTVQLIDLRQNKMIYSFQHDNFQVSTDTHKVALSPDGRYACVGSHDGSLIVWNTTNGQLENLLEKKHKTMVTGVAWQQEGKFVASCEKHRQAILWSD